MTSLAEQARQETIKKIREETEWRINLERERQEKAQEQGEKLAKSVISFLPILIMNSAAAGKSYYDVGMGMGGFDKFTPAQRVAADIITDWAKENGFECSIENQEKPWSSKAREEVLKIRWATS